MKSTDVGEAILVGAKESKLGKIPVMSRIFIHLHTPGKIDFVRPKVAAKSIHKGQMATAVNATEKNSKGWNTVISKCSYQWQRNTKNIKGATKLNYKATSADVGKTLRLRTACTVTATAKTFSGFTANTKYSGAVRVS
ncbi:hypothetical protein GCM10023166_03140 [Paeniglutamicibacter cryotolerans]